MTSPAYEVLKGIRVIDLGMITAGASTSAILADLGAEVIKVEGPNYLDPFRDWNGKAEAADWWNRSPSFVATNRNKRGVCLNLKTDHGRDVFLRLVEESDVVVENFRVGVLEGLRIDYATLSKVNPRIILASISSQGATGPQARNVSFGSTLEASSGFASLIRYPDTATPHITGRSLNYPDQVVSLFAAGMVMSAIVDRHRTGRGGHIDMSQREVTSYLIGEVLLAALNGGSLEETAPTDDNPLEGVFASRGGEWVAVSPGDDARRSLPALLGASPSEPVLREWIAARSGREAVAQLRAAGCAAEIAVTGANRRTSDRFAVAGAFAADPEGNMVKGLPLRIGSRDVDIMRCAPELGEHNHELAAALGMSEQEYRALWEDGIFADKPSA
ncbi:CaiB/BaiF CoA transferase family protein [Pseudochelatococcus sp. B33]